MVQQSKKSYQAQPSAKLAANNAKAAEYALAAAESTRESAEKVVKIGSSVMKDILSSSADEAQRAQEKIFSIGRDSAETMAKSADALTKVMHEAIASSRDNIEACVECSNVTASLTKEISTEVFESANQAFSDSVEFSKNFLACRTINDMMELNNKAIKRNCDNLFSQSAKLSNLLFEYASEALEPINERAAQATEQFNKALSS